jgi:hypothetical protein
LRERAIKRLKKRHDFAVHLLVYALVNGFIVVIWLLSSSHSFFWPIFPMLGWGIAIVLNAWDVWRGDEPSEATIEREVQRIRRDL